MPRIEDLVLNRDPRTAFGGGATASRPRMPVGEVTELFDGQQPKPTAAPQAPAAPGPAAAAAAPTPRRGTLSRAGIGALGGAAGVALGAAPEALDVGKVLANPAATGIDVATQASEGIGRMASAGAGAIGGAKIGAMAAPFLGPLAPVGPVAGTILGGLAGYYSADKAIKGGRAAVGTDPQSPVDRLPPAPMAAPAGIGDMPARMPYSDARQGPAVATASGPAAADTGTIRYDPRTKTYSGTDVNEGAQIVGGVKNGRGTGRGGFSVIDTSEGASQDQMELARLQAESTERAKGFAGNQPGGGIGGIGGGTFGGFGERNSERNANFDRNTVLSKLESASRLAGSGRGRSDARQSLASASAQPLPYEVQQAREQQTATTRRGQDISALSQQKSGANQLDIASMQGRTQRDIASMSGRTQRDVANIGSDGRAEAAAMRSKQPVVVGGGQVPYTDPQTGETKMVLQPQRIVNPLTGEEIGARPQAPKTGAAALAGDPKAVAIKNDPKMSDAEKRKQLQALGYQ